MGAVGFVARSGSRRRVAAGLVLAVLVGLAAGAVLASWAGARRTGSAYGRLLAATNHADAVVTREGGDPAPLDPTLVEGAPGVASRGVVNGYGAIPLQTDGLPDLTSGFALLAPGDDVAMAEIDRPLLLDGRLPDPRAADEILVDRLGRAAGHPVGSSMDVCLFDFASAAPFAEVLDGASTPEDQRRFVDEACRTRTLRVVGVARSADEEVVNDASADQSFLYGTRALVAEEGSPAFSFVLVDLRPDADLDAFVDHLLARAPEGGVSVQSSALRATVTDRTAAPHVRALQLFAALAALASLGVLGPAVVRWTATPDSDVTPLRAAGLRRQQLRSAAASRGAALGLVAAVVAVGLAVAASSQFPVGVAADIEPFPGTRVDGLVLLAGIVAVVAACAALGAVAPVRARRASRRPSRIADAVQRTGATPAAAAGVRAALSRDANGAGPLVTVGGVGVAVAAVAAALTFQASLGRLLDTPDRWGWTWDAIVEGYDDGLPPELVGAVDGDPTVAGVTLGYRTALVRPGGSVPAYAFDAVRGDVAPAILEGRVPVGDDEVALGGQTLDRLHADVGDRLPFRGPNGTAVDVTVVGRTVLPVIALGEDLTVGEGAVVDRPLLDALGGGDVGFALVDLRTGADADDLRRSLEASGAVSPEAGNVIGPSFTGDLRGYGAVRSTPLLLAALLAVLGLGVLAHTMTTSARRRRRELAVLRAIGFLRRDLAATICWSGLALVAGCVVVALPVGVAAGRTVWREFANGIGVVDDPLTESAPLVTVVVLTAVVTLALSVFPGMRARNVRPSEVLWSE